MGQQIKIQNLWNGFFAAICRVFKIISFWKKYRLFRGSSFLKKSIAFVYPSKYVHKLRKTKKQKLPANWHFLTFFGKWFFFLFLFVQRPPLLFSSRKRIPSVISFWEDVAFKYPFTWLCSIWQLYSFEQNKDNISGGLYRHFFGVMFGGHAVNGLKVPK